MTHIIPLVPGYHASGLDGWSTNSLEYLNQLFADFFLYFKDKLANSGIEEQINILSEELHKFYEKQKTFLIEYMGDNPLGGYNEKMIDLSSKLHEAGALAKDFTTDGINKATMDVSTTQTLPPILPKPTLPLPNTTTSNSTFSLFSSKLRGSAPDTGKTILESLS